MEDYAAEANPIEWEWGGGGKVFNFCRLFQNSFNRLYNLS